MFAPAELPVKEIVGRFEKALSARLDMIIRSQCVLNYTNAPKASEVCDSNFSEVVSVPTFGTDLNGNQCLTSNYGFSLRLSRDCGDGFTFGSPLVIEVSLHKAFNGVCCNVVFNVFTKLDEHLNGCVVRTLDICKSINSAKDIRLIHNLIQCIGEVIIKPNFMDNYSKIKS